MTDIVKMAKRIESQDTNVIGYGISSAPMAGIRSNNLWKAMLFCIRNPDKCGMNVSNVKIFDNVRVDEQCQQISYRALELERGGESLDERIFAIRQQPLRMEMWCRHSKDELRVDWQAPKAVAQDVFDKIKKFAKMMQNDPKKFDAKFGAGADEAQQGARGF